MKELNSLRNHLLIAMPAMADSWFASTVTYLCEHNDDGAMGIVLNKPLDIGFADICLQLDIDRLEHIRPTIFTGGPVSQEQGFILHREPGDWSSTMAVTESVQLTSSKDILRAMAQGRGPHDYLLALGYAGWSPGQLDQELRDNTWLTLEATPDLLFGQDYRDLYDIALSKLGISAEFLSSDAGHA